MAPRVLHDSRDGSSDFVTRARRPASRHPSSSLAWRRCWESQTSHPDRSFFLANDSACAASPDTSRAPTRHPKALSHPHRKDCKYEITPRDQTVWQSALLPSTLPQHTHQKKNFKPAYRGTIRQRDKACHQDRLASKGTTNRSNPLLHGAPFP
ncbi:hypothetical protein VTO42DRAFT_8549 [Malbranchea cinnamomea]